MSGLVLSPLGLVGGAMGVPGINIGRASVEIDGRCVPFSLEGIETARLARLQPDEQASSDGVVE